MRFITDAPPPIYVNTPALVESAVRHCMASSMLGVDTETLGKWKNEETNAKHHNMNDQIVVLGLSPDEESRYLVPRVNLQHFKPVLEAVPIPKALHKYQFDAHRFLNAGISLKGPIADGLVMDWLLDEDKRENKHDLKSCGRDFFEIPMREYGDLFGKEDPNQISRPEHPLFGKYLDYSSLDPWVSRKLCLRHMEALSQVQVWPDNDWTLRDHYWDVEEPQIRCLHAMERRGITLDLEHLNKASSDLQAEMEGIALELNRLVGAPINPNSGPQVQELFFGKMGLPSLKKTKGGAASVDEETLLRFANQMQIKEAQLIVDYRGAAKMKGTYTDGLIKRCWIDGRVHTSYNPTKTTGRLACVSGRTPLVTSRGTFTFEEYLPQVGDLAPTHTGCWKPILRKIYKGLDTMFRVSLSNGAVLECTAEHRILTPSGWRSVGSLNIGEEICSYVSFDQLYEQPGQHQGCDGPLPEPGEANAGSHRGDDGDDAPQRDGNHENAYPTRAEEVREGAALLPLQDGRAEPHVGQEWLPAPQLHRGHRGWAWVPLEEGGNEVRVRSPDCNGRPSRAVLPAGQSGSPSHRREPKEQRPGQLGPGDAGGPQAPSSIPATLSYVTPLGEMGVWDIEVAEDHSYASQGFFHHNSSDPNLQNLPQASWDTHNIRAGFVADSPAECLIVNDYSQLEMRVLACASNDPTMIGALSGGLDMHTKAAADVLGIPYAQAAALKKAEDPAFLAMRTGVKAVGFGIVYGAQAPKIADTISKELKKPVSKAEGQDFINKYLAVFPGIKQYMDSYIALAHRQGYVQTIAGRFRRLSKIHSPRFMDWSGAERQAINAPIQGSAADIVKKAMIMCEIDGYLASLGCTLRLQVHDELVFNCPRETAQEAAGIIQSYMEHPFDDELPVPLSAIPKIVNTWKEGK